VFVCVVDIVTLNTAARDETYEEALKEMMKRIKSGQALKPTITAEASSSYIG